MVGDKDGDTNGLVVGRRDGNEVGGSEGVADGLNTWRERLSREECTRLHLSGIISTTW
jgi:hypothetical protein